MSTIAAACKRRETHAHAHANAVSRGRELATQAPPSARASSGPAPVFCQLLHWQGQSTAALTGAVGLGTDNLLGACPIDKLCQLQLCKELVAIGVCKRCVLRYAGERYSGTYQAPDSAYARLLGANAAGHAGGTGGPPAGTGVPAGTPAADDQDGAEPPCTACLGLLQIEDDFVDNVAAVIKQGGRKFESFSLALLHPVEVGVAPRATARGHQMTFRHPQFAGHVPSE